MPLGRLIDLGPAAMVELTGLPTPCVLIGRFQAGLKRQVLSSAEAGPPFKCGVLGVVRSGGPVAVGDAARVRLPFSSFHAYLLCRESLMQVGGPISTVAMLLYLRAWIFGRCWRPLSRR